METSYDRATSWQLEYLIQKEHLYYLYWLRHGFVIPLKPGYEKHTIVGCRFFDARERIGARNSEFAKTDAQC